jgi:hypothetical protein
MTEYSEKPGQLGKMHLKIQVRKSWSFDMGLTLKIKSEKQFKGLLKKGRYQIFILSSPMWFPISFAVHTWIVVSDPNNKIIRYDTGIFMQEPGLKHINVLPPCAGIIRLPKTQKFGRFNSRIIYYLEGKNKSLAYKLFNFLKNNFDKYTIKTYKMYPGPNSNTFPQWVLNHFPEIKFKLPWNAFGKNYLKQHQNNL